jgi:uncharacterized membrane protein
MSTITKKLTRAGVIAGLYVVLIFPVISFASGFVQFRPSEALTLLPVFFPESTFALAIGCLLANLITGCSLLDVIFGAMITLFAGVCTNAVGKLKINKHVKFVVAGVFPVLFNAFLLPIIWYYAYGELLTLYFYNVLSLLISQTLSVYLLGSIVYYGVDKAKGLNNPLFE